jgi:hypothetical protein
MRYEMIHDFFFSVSQSVPIKKHKASSTIASRNEFIDGYKHSGLSKRAFGRGNGLKLSTFCNWLRNEEKYVGVKNSKQCRKVSQSEARPFIELEKKLMTWILYQNDNGIPIKGKHMIAQMKSLRDERIRELSENGQEVQSLKVKFLFG